MKTVYKYPLPKREMTVNLPVGAEVLHVFEQDNVPTIWALVADQPFLPRVFTTYFTGEPTEEHIHNRTYIGTVHLLGRSLVATYSRNIERGVRGDDTNRSTNRRDCGHD